MKQQLLIPEPPLQVLPSLAVAVGLNQAVVLQQLHYWLMAKTAHIREGVPWVYNSYPEWRKQFPFWSIPTLQRIFRKLEKSGLIRSANFNASPTDRTKWYTIVYEALPSCEIARPSYQTDMPTISERYDLPETTEYVTPSESSSLHSEVSVSPLKGGAPPPKKITKANSVRAKPEWQAPEWWIPLRALRGYRDRNYFRAAAAIEEACTEFGLSVPGLVGDYAEYYSTGGRVMHGWTDPVRALTRTLHVQVGKAVAKRRSDGSGTTVRERERDFDPAVDQARTAEDWGTVTEYYKQPVRH